MAALFQTLRQLTRKPTYALTVIVTLALAVGVNTAVFSVVNAVLLRSLPYAHPDRLGILYARAQDGSQDSEGALDGRRWEILRDQVPSLLSAVYAGMASGANFQTGSSVQYLHAGRVSKDYFQVLDLKPLLGRTFSSSEDTPHGPLAVVLGNQLWRTRFASDPAVLGRQIKLKGEQYTVIGVLPQASLPLAADLYIALQPSRTGEGSGTNFDPLVRLRDRATWAEADTQLRAMTLRPGGASWHTVPLQRGQTAALRPQVTTLQLASAFILLIACANLAGLALVRTMQRSSELATRLALGATRGQLQRQLWVENLLLALAGGIAAIAVSAGFLRVVLSLLPEGFLPVASVPLDGTVLAITLLVSITASALFSIGPVLSLRRLHLRSRIVSRAVLGAGSVRLRQSLIAAEVALTVLLLSAAGVLIHTLVHLENLPPGFNPDGIYSAKASLDDAHYRDPAAFSQLLTRSLGAVQQIHGVTGAAVGLSLPYERGLNDDVTLRDGSSAGKDTLVSEVYITPTYLATLQIPLLSGRAFLDSDTLTSEPVALVNRSFATHFYGTDSPIGHYLNKNTRIVGVTEDTAKAPALDTGAPLTAEQTVYVPATQMSAASLALFHTWFQPSWIVRTATPLHDLDRQMQQALTSADPNLPFSGFYSMADLRAEALVTQRVEVTLLTTLATLALLLSAVGIFSLVANLVLERKRETGIRIAFGSSIPRAMVQVGRAGILAAGTGLIVGLASCTFTLRVIRSALYGVQPNDPQTLIAVTCTLGLIALLAASLPTLRIARGNPLQALREE